MEQADRSPCNPAIDGMNDQSPGTYDRNSPYWHGSCSRLSDCKHSSRSHGTPPYMAPDDTHGPRLRHIPGRDDRHRLLQHTVPCRLDTSLRALDSLCPARLHRIQYDKHHLAQGRIPSNRPSVDSQHHRLSLRNQHRRLCHRHLLRMHRFPLELCHSHSSHQQSGLSHRSRHRHTTGSAHTIPRRTHRRHCPNLDRYKDPGRASLLKLQKTAAAPKRARLPEK